jgi:hypothetical protein
MAIERVRGVYICGLHSLRSNQYGPLFPFSNRLGAGPTLFIFFTRTVGSASMRGRCPISNRSWFSPGRKFRIKKSLSIFSNWGNEGLFFGVLVRRIVKNAQNAHSTHIYLVFKIPSLKLAACSTLNPYSYGKTDECAYPQR